MYEMNGRQLGRPFLFQLIHGTTLLHSTHTWYIRFLLYHVYFSHKKYFSLPPTFFLHSIDI